VPVKDSDILTVTWNLPYVGTDHDSKPLNYHSHLFGHEGPNSLLSYLKKEGLALELGAGPDHELWGLSQLDLQITLTKKGLKQWERVLEIVFKYAQINRDAGPQQYIFDEVKRIGEIKFEFMSKGDPFSTVRSYASKMQ
jgi:insulysin